MGKKYRVPIEILYKILHTFRMQNTWDIFSSKARARILRALYCQTQPIPLRHVALLTDLPVYSVQNALTSLVEEQLLLRTEVAHNVLFELNRVHPLYSILESLFVAEMTAQIQINAATLHHKAQQILAFANAANTMLRRAKQRRRQ